MLKGWVTSSYFWGYEERDSLVTLCKYIFPNPCVLGLEKEDEELMLIALKYFQCMPFAEFTKSALASLKSQKLQSTRAQFSSSNIIAHSTDFLSACRPGSVRAPLWNVIKQTEEVHICSHSSLTFPIAGSNLWSSWIHYYITEEQKPLISRNPSQRASPCVMNMIIYMPTRLEQNRFSACSISLHLSKDGLWLFLWDHICCASKICRDAPKTRIAAAACTNISLRQHKRSIRSRTARLYWWEREKLECVCYIASEKYTLSQLKKRLTINKQHLLK
jgi:hypothetical protein